MTDTTASRNAPSLLLIGAGKMGQAMLRGWRQSSKLAKITVIDPAPSPDLPGMVDLLNPDLAALQDAPPDIVVLAVKPQFLNEIAAHIEGIPQDCLVISILAGIRIEQLQALLPGRRIIRAMPNTPAALGKGVTVMCADASVSDSAHIQATQLLETVGAVNWLEDENLMDAVTAISGSGPAYLFHFAEALAEAGKALGLPDDLAMQLARQTVAAAGVMLDALPESAAQLRENVTSPGGTTAAALEVLRDSGALAELLRQATQAAAKRSQELSDTN